MAKKITDKKLKQKAEQAMVEAVDALGNAVQANREAHAGAVETKEKKPKLTRAEIVEHVRKIRRQFEETRDIYRASMFNDADMCNDLHFNGLPHTVETLAGWLNPNIDKVYSACCTADKHDKTEDAAGDLYWNCLSTAYQLGVFMGVVVAATSPSDIDKAEKGLVCLAGMQLWVSKE